MRIFVHSDFENNLKILTKEEAKQLSETIDELLDNSLENVKGLQDITISDKVILSYRYDNKKDLLDIALKFVDVVNHDDLQGECLHEDVEEVEEQKLGTFDEQMNFLAKDEQEAIDGYEKIIAIVDDEHVKEQLEKILVEERAHKEFLEKVKEDPTLEYSHEEEHEEEDTEPLEDEIDINTVEVINDLNDDDIEDDVVEESLNEDLEEDDVSWLVPDKGNKKTKFEFDDEDDYVPTDEDIAENMADLNGENYGN